MRKTTLILLILTGLIFSMTTSVVAQKKVREADSLTPYWSLLDAGKAYREKWRGLQKTYLEMVKGYTRNLPDYDTSHDTNPTPQELFLAAAAGFRDVLATSIDDIELQEATWGLQESLNEYMAGQMLVGNDYLIKGLRVRFPSTGDPEDPDQLTLLTRSEQFFHEGITEIVEDLRTNPGTMRSMGEEIPGFKMFVRNSVASADLQGETIENELYRFTNLVERKAMAGNSKGKRMFFFGNVNDVDNFPYGNFPGKEDLDFNKNRIMDEAGRAEAAVQFKKSAHSTYLHTAVLAAVQNINDFDRNNGYALKRQIKDAQVVYDDILGGLNPLDLQGDFIPYQPVEHFLTFARNRINDAITAEGAAKNAERTYDVYKDNLTHTLRSQQENYLDRIVQMTGQSVGDLNLLLKEDRDTYLELAATSVAAGKGEMGIQNFTIEETVLSAKRAETALKQIPQKIQIENERNGTIASVISSNAEKMSALSLAEGIANSIRVEAGYSGGQAHHVFAVNPQSTIVGMLRGKKDILQAMQQVSIANSNSAATIKQLLLEQALAYLSVESAQKVVQREEARLDEMWAQLGRYISNYVGSREDMATYYWSNPAYRLDRDQLTEAAETSFETAMIAGFYAAKALEYLWSERFSNPIPGIDGGLPEVLSPSYDPYVRAESVFSAQFASLKAPNLKDYFGALHHWDMIMRQARNFKRETGIVVLSLRKDILGFDSNDSDYDHLAFKNFVSEHRIKGKNPNNDDLQIEFTIQIGDEQLFPALPNLKIVDIGINLMSDADRSIRGSADASPVFVDLIMLDEAVIRTFFADFDQGDDDLLTYNLEQARTLDKSPFIATVQATVDNYADPLPSANVGLANHSPACTRWVLRMKMNRGVNQDLLLKHLEDIELKFRYSYGKPAPVNYAW